MEKEVKKQKLFGLWYGLSLACGLITAGLLIALIFATFSNIIGGNSVVANYSDGQGFVALIASLLVFSVFYVLGSFKAGKVLGEKLKTNDAIKVLSIIYAVFLAVPAFIMLILFIVPLIELGVGTSTDTMASVAQCVSSILAFAVLLKMAFYHLGFWKKWLKRTPWAIGFSIFTIAIIVLFMIFPGGQLRDITRDQMVSNDLNKIDTAIREYFDKNGKLPTKLGKLEIEGLKTSIDDFTFNIKKDSDPEFFRYQICANFLVNTGNVLDYSFDMHPAGKVCFDRDVYSYRYFEEPYMID